MMAHYGKHPRISRDTPAPDDVIWHWFVCNGPHGERFDWTNRDLELLRRFIGEQSAAIPDFEEHARSIARQSLQDEDAVLILKGIHVLAAIGTDEEMLLVKPLTEVRNLEVARHARTAVFERRIRKKPC